MKKYVNKYPIMFSVLLMICSVAVTFLPLNIVCEKIMEKQTANYFAGAIEQTFVSIMLIIFMIKMNKFEQIGFRLEIKQIWIGWPAMIFILLNVSDWFNAAYLIDITHLERIVWYVIVYFTTGLFEEILCRGIVFPIILQKWENTKLGRFGAVLLSSLLFGLFHFIHFILGHASLLATLAQVIYETFFGVLMCAIVIRNNSIYPAIILHGIIDIVGSTSEIQVGGGINTEYMTMSLGQAIGCVIIAFPLFVYGLYILRNYFKKDYNKEFERKHSQHSV